MNAEYDETKGGWLVCQNRRCRMPDREYCNDGYCRECHVSLSFESCVDGSYVNDLRSQYGLLPVNND